MPKSVEAEPFEPDQRVLTLQNPDASPQDAESAFASIYTEFSGPLKGYVLRMVSSPELAEEIVQESLLNAWKGIDKFDAHDEKSSLKAWLYRITRNRTFNTTRGLGKSNGDVSYEDAYAAYPDAHGSSDDDPVSHLIHKEEIEVIGSLSEIVKETLGWNLDEYTYEQIAAMNGLTVGAVKSRLVRAREASQKARSQLGLTEAEKVEIKEAKKVARRQAREAHIEEELLVAA